MKNTISAFAIAILMTSAPSMLITQSAFAEDEATEVSDDTGASEKEVSDDFVEPAIETETVENDFEGLHPYDPIRLNDDGTDYYGVDPVILQTSGGPEVQREVDSVAKPKSRPVEISNSSDDDTPFHEIMRKKRRAARSN